MEFYHGVYDERSVEEILREGLRKRSSVSSDRGQASAYPIILEYEDISVTPVSYRPGDFFTKSISPSPKAIYIYTEEYKGVRDDWEEIARELGSELSRLEREEGISPEEFGGFDNLERVRASQKATELIREMDASMSGRASRSGESIQEFLRKIAGSIPVRKIFRDRDGEIDWERTKFDGSVFDFNFAEKGGSFEDLLCEFDLMGIAVLEYSESKDEAPWMVFSGNFRRVSSLVNGFNQESSSFDSKDRLQIEKLGSGENKLYYQGMGSSDLARRVFGDFAEYLRKFSQER